MTGKTSLAAQEFLVRLRRIDNAGFKVRDTLVLWAIARQPGMMGREVAMQLGFASRSLVQDGIARLIEGGYVEDRRVIHSLKDRQIVPNDLHILPAGEKLLAEIVPA